MITFTFLGFVFVGVLCAIFGTAAGGLASRISGVERNAVAAVLCLAFSALAAALLIMSVAQGTLIDLAIAVLLTSAVSRGFTWVLERA